MTSAYFVTSLPVRVAIELAGLLFIQSSNIGGDALQTLSDSPTF